MQEADHHRMLGKSTKRPGTKHLDLSTPLKYIQCKEQKWYLRGGIDPTGATQMDDSVAGSGSIVRMVSLRDGRRETREETYSGKTLMTLPPNRLWHTTQTLSSVTVTCRLRVALGSRPPSPSSSCACVEIFCTF